MSKQSMQQQIDELTERAFDASLEDCVAPLDDSLWCLKQSTELGYDRGRALSLRNLTRIYLNKNMMEQALEYAREAIALLEVSQSIRELTQVQNLVAEVYWNLADYPQALSHNLRTLQLAQKGGLRSMEAHALANLAMVYVQMQDFGKVREMLSLAMPIFIEVDDQSGLFHSLNNMAMLCLQEQDYEAAEQFARRGHKIAVENRWRLNRVIVHDTLGLIYASQSRLEEARQAYFKSLKINGGEFKRNFCKTTISLGWLHAACGEHEAALEQAHGALKFAVDMNNKQLGYEAHQLLSEAYEAQGDTQRALQHLKQFHELQQAVHTEKSKHEIANLEVRYRTTAARNEAQLLRQTNAELQHEIAERLRVESELMEAKNSAERAKVAAEAASRAKSEFLSNMSHELRTPLNGILGYAQILARASSLERDQLEGIKIIQHSGEHLLTLINDILDISKIEARRLELQNGELHLESFLDGIVGLMQMRAEQQGIELDFHVHGDLPRGIWVDEKRLRQVLINLLGNAIKFTKRGSVALSVTTVLSKEDRAHLRFEVIDTGIGIASEHITNIFEPFEQVGNSQERAAGTGLGLAISKRLIEAMDGKLQVASTLGEGSRFWFEIEVPTAVAHEEVRSILPPVIGYHGVPQSLLIVDDTTYNRLLLRSLLAPLGFELLEAVNATEALALSAEYKPDLIFLDLVLPDFNGLEIVHDLRRNAPDTKILAVSASIIDLTRETIIKAGCDDFLPKPIRVDELLLIVQQLLDIEWIYEHVSAEPEFSYFEPQTALLPTEACLAHLLDLAMIGDLFGVEREARELQQRAPDLYAFAHHVIRLAHTFEEEALLSLLQECHAMVKKQTPLALATH